jgi:hypothetical protein
MKEVPKTRELPEAIQESFKYMAHYLIGEMNQSELDVILVDAPDQRHYGHKIRMAVNHNPPWWSEMYMNHPIKLDRKCFLDALKKVYEGKDEDFKYHLMAREKIKDFLIDGLYGEMIDEQVKEFFKHFEMKAL